MTGWHLFPRWREPGKLATVNVKNSCKKVIPGMILIERFSSFFHNVFHKPKG